MKDNELIAEFMGREITGVSEYEGKYTIRVSPEKPISENKSGRSIEAKYDTSWDWLMPVVEKIEEIRVNDKMGLGYQFRVTISEKECVIDSYIRPSGKEFLKFRKIGLTGDDGKILATYFTVIDFIKWYNKENSNGKI